MDTAPKSSTAPIVMDARKFVRHINNSAAAKLKFFEESIERLGKKAGKNLRLTSLDNNNIIYEDVDKNVFYIADVKKNKKGKIQLENIKPIQIVEEDKASQYSKNIKDLVDSICEGDLSHADKVFNKIESQRFRSKVIPESGWITLKDGVARHIPVSTRIVKEDHAKTITKLFSEAVRDTVEVDRGRIVRGTLSETDEKFIIPINEYTRRRLVAFKMRNVAMEAYNSQAFQNIVLESAALVCEGKVADAVNLTSRFLKEEQEFSLLTFSEMVELVENTMATRAQFNSILAEDVAKVLYRTNAKVNRESILDAWTKMAQKSNASGLLNNVNALSESRNFERDHDKFLNIVFNEDMSVQTVRAKAYRTALKVIASVLPDLEDEDGEEVSTSMDELNELIERLSGNEPDTNAVLQAEELLSSISDSLVDSIQDLESFDSMPGMDGEVDEADDDEGQLASVPEIPMSDEEDEDMGMDMDMDMGADEEEGEGEEMPALGESIQQRLVPVESMQVNNLMEELEDWNLHGNSFLREYGYDQCYDDMQRYIKRCIALGPKANTIRENFESMRTRLVDNEPSVLQESNDDLYAESVVAALNGSKVLSENSRDPERDPAFWGKINVSFEDRIDRAYRRAFTEGEQPWEMGSGLEDAGGLRMDDMQGTGGVASQSPSKSDGRTAGGSAAGYHQSQRGSGVAGRGAKPVDGRSGQHSTSGSAGGSLRMDDMQGADGVQSSSTHSSDGRSGMSRSSQASESTVNVSGGDPALAKGGHSSVGLSMGSEFQKKGQGGVVNKKLTKGDGKSGDAAHSAGKFEMSGLSPAGTDMSELQGRDGVEDDSLDHDAHKGQGKVGTDGGLKSSRRGGDMSDHQGNGGVAENLTPERIAALISEMDDEEDEEEPVVEGEVPESFKANWGKNKKEDDGESDKDEYDTDAEVAKEDQYKSGTSKFKTGFKKSSMTPMEDMDHVAAFVGSPDQVADAIDRALGGMDQMGEVDSDLEDLESSDEGDLSDEDMGDLDEAMEDALSESAVELGQGRHYKCPKCDAVMKKSPVTDSVGCGTCGYTQDLCSGCYSVQCECNK